MDLLLRFVYLHLEPGGEIAVGDLPGGILPVQKAQALAAEAVHTPLSISRASTVVSVPL